MKYFFLVISVIGVIILIKLLLFYKIKKEVKSLEDITGLHVPTKASVIDYETKRVVSENRYPYIFFAKLKVSKEDYFQMISPVLINRLDSNNIVYTKTSGAVFTNKSFFWGFETIKEIKNPIWWNIPNQLNFSFLFANIFSDNPTKQIGNINTYNGKIVSYYNAPYCFLLIECWPPSLTSGTKMQGER